MSDSRLSRDDRSRERSPTNEGRSSKKSKKSKKSKSSHSSSRRPRRSRSRSVKRSKSRTPKSTKKSKKSERKRSKSPKKSKKSRSERSGRGRSPPPPPAPTKSSDSKRSRRRADKKRGYRPVSSGSSSDDWKNTSDEGASRSRSPKRHRRRSSSSSRSRSRSSSSGSSYGRPAHRNGGYRGKNWRGGGRAPRGRRGAGSGPGGFRADAPTLRGRGYWRPNYIAYGRNIFPGGESSETHSDSSRSWSSSSSSRSATPEHYKDTPPNSPPKQEKEKTPEKGLMDTIQQQEIERINNIMAQLDRAGKESQQKSSEIRRGQFVGTFGAEKDIFEAESVVPLRKEFKERADFQKEKHGENSAFPAKKKAKLFDYDESLDQGMSLRKQMEQKESKDREKLEEEAQKQQLAQEQRIKNRVESVGGGGGEVKTENGMYTDEHSGVVIARRRKSTNMRSELDNDKEEQVDLKKEPSDAEFVKTLNASFEKERGHKIQIRRDSGVIRTELSFSELAAKMSKAKGSVVRGKVASSGLKSGGFGVPKILGRRETNTENKFLKPNLKEHLESMDNQNDLLYKQKKQEEMEKQGEMVQEQILSTAPLQSTNIGPIKPVVQTTVRRLNKTGVVLPVSLLNPPKSCDTTTGGSSGSHVRTPPVLTSGSGGGSGGGWKEPKSGWNESPPRSGSNSSQPVQKIHATPNVTLARVVQSESSIQSTPPPVIKREYSLAPPIVHQYPPMPPVPPPVIHRVYNTPPPPVVMPYQHHVAKTSSVILKREFDSDSEGPTPPPPGDSVDLAQVYQRHPQLWQGFVTIKKHAAMVQLHYLAGDKLLVQSVLPVFPTMTGSDNSKHPALKVTSRVRLEESTFASLRAKMRETKKFTFLLGLPCGVSETDVAQQKHTLRVNFMQYFASKAAAGVVEIKCDGIEYLVYMFPQCDLMREQLSKCVDFAKQTAGLPQLMIAIFPST